MSYQVFARKYRPQTFSEVVGQDHVVRTLKNAIEQNRLAQAYLFVGPRGIGKTTTARILAKALCCQHGPTPNPCGVCDACREIANGTSLDVIEIDGASNNKVENVRDLIENARFAPAVAKYKIYLIDEVHMLTAQAFNALLKTLEEPPPHVKFIFATTEPDKVLPTILSRCQRFDLRRIPAPLIAAHLQHIAREEGLTLPDDAAAAVARGAQGGLRDAESMLDQLVSFCGSSISADDVRGVFGFTAPEVVAGFAASMLGRDASAALHQLQREAEAGRDLLRLLADLIAHLRNLLVCQVNPGSLEGEHDDAVLGMIRQQAEAIDANRLLALIDHFAAAEGRMKWTPDKKLHFEIALIKAVQLLGEATLDEVLGELAAIRRGDPSAPAPRARTAAPSASPALSTTRPTPISTPASAAPAPSTEAPSAPPMRLSEQFAAAQKAAAAPRPEPAPASPAPAPNAPTPTPVDAPAPAPALSGREIWDKVTEEVRAKRPLIRNWVEKGQYLDLKGDTVHVGFPAQDDNRIVVDSLSSPSNRNFLDELLARHGGRPLKLKLELRADLAPPPPPELPSAPEPEPEPHPDPVDEPAAPAAAADPYAEFRNDPLIQRALELFDAEIVEIKKSTKL